MKTKQTKAALEWKLRTFAKRMGDFIAPLETAQHLAANNKQWEEAELFKADAASLRAELAKLLTTADRVIFRKFKDGDVIAWLPDVPANPGRCMSYMHIGQHCEGQYPADTIPANPEESAPLLRELLALGYGLRAVKRLQR